MNRSKIIALVATIVIFSAIIGGTVYFLSFKTVSFTSTKRNLKVDIYTSTDNDHKNKLAEAKVGDTLRLQAGSYAAVPTGEDYDKLATFFTVKDTDTTVDIIPNLKPERLQELLEEEAPGIENSLKTTYAPIINGFEIKKGKLYREGEWYATTLTQIPEDPRDEGDIYHVIFNKKDGKWTMVHKPVLVLTTAELKDVPLDILQDANRMGD